MRYFTTKRKKESIVLKRQSLQQKKFWGKSLNPAIWNKRQTIKNRNAIRGPDADSLLLFKTIIANGKRLHT